MTDYNRFLLESVEQRLPVRIVGSLNPSQVKSITYQIDTRHCHASVGRIGQGMVSTVPG